MENGWRGKYEGRSVESPQGKSFGGMRTTEWRRFSELAINRRVSSLAQISVDPPKPHQSPCTCSWTDTGSSGWPVVDRYIWREYPRTCLCVFGCILKRWRIRNEDGNDAFAGRSGLHLACNYLLMVALLYTAICPCCVRDGRTNAPKLYNTPET